MMWPNVALLLLASCSVSLSFTSLPLHAKPLAVTSQRQRCRQEGRKVRGSPPPGLCAAAMQARARGSSRSVLGRSMATAEGGAEPRVFDRGAVSRWGAATLFQWGWIMACLRMAEVVVLKRIDPRASTALVFGAFGFLSLRSRIFSQLDNRRPTPGGEDKAKAELKRPKWMPPGYVFPIVWSTIGILRAVSSTLAWRATGQLFLGPSSMFVGHLCIGDTWNTINNVEKKRGCAVTGVLFVWASALATTLYYYKVDPLAGMVLAPSVVWLTVASCLVTSIWKLNGKEPLYPVKATLPPAATASAASD